jgi:predicted Zn-dependent protease
VKRWFIVAMSTALLCGLCGNRVFAQGAAGKAGAVSTHTASINAVQNEAAPVPDPNAEEELQKGTALTRHGDFSAAIPHLLAARGKVSNPYAANFNLALCYIGVGQNQQAIEILNDLRRSGSESADVENLLAQAYVGNGQPNEALESFEKAVSIAPQSEKLYLFVADACMEHQDFALGLKLIDVGLGHLAQSPRLHYQKAMFLSQIDQLDRAKVEFELAAKFGQGSEIAYLSAAHEALLEGNIPEALRAAREGVGKGFQDAVLLTVLGEALLRSGVAPGERGFSEAEAALEKAATERPNDPAAQIGFGQICLIAGRLDDAIAHLEKAQQLRPNQPSVYANLARAYQRRGDVRQAELALAALEKLNLAHAEQIRSAPGDRKMSYGGADAAEVKPRPQ